MIISTWGNPQRFICIKLTSKKGKRPCPDVASWGLVWEIFATLTLCLLSLSCQWKNTTRMDHCVEWLEPFQIEKISLTQALRTTDNFKLGRKWTWTRDIYFVCWSHRCHNPSLNSLQLAGCHWTTISPVSHWQWTGHLRDSACCMQDWVTLTHIGTLGPSRISGTTPIQGWV